MSSQAMAIGQQMSELIPSMNGANINFAHITWQTPSSNLQYETVRQILKSINSGQSKENKKKLVKRDITTNFIPITSSSVANQIYLNQSTRQQVNGSSQQLYRPLSQLDNNLDYYQETTESQDIYNLANIQQQQQQKPFIQNENLQPYQHPLPNRRFFHSNQQHKNKKPVYAPINQQTVNRILSLLLLFIISICGCIGTIFIMSALTVIESLQTRGNCYLVSLALSHLLVTLIVIPSSALQIMAGEGIDERHLCHFQWLVLEFSSIVSHLSFFFIAADNYLGYKSSEKIITTSADILAIGGSSTTTNSGCANNNSNNSDQQHFICSSPTPETNHPDNRYQFMTNTCPSIRVSPIQTCDPLIDNKQQSKVEVKQKCFMDNLIGGIFPSYKRENLFESPISSLISSSLANQSKPNSVIDNKQKLRLAHQFTGAELSKQSCLGYRNCCGRLKVIFWILSIWFFAFAYTLHQHDLSYGPNFCSVTLRPRSQTLNGNNNNNNNNSQLQKLSQIAISPVIGVSNIDRLNTRSLDLSERKTNKVKFLGTSERLYKEPTVSEDNQQNYLVNKGEVLSSKQNNLELKLKSNSQKDTTQTLPLVGNPLQRLAKKVVQASELTTITSNLDQTKITFVGSGKLSDSDRGSQFIGKEALLEKDGNLLKLASHDKKQDELSSNAKFVPSARQQQQQQDRSLIRIRRNLLISRASELKFGNSQMNSRRIDQLRTVKSLHDIEQSKFRDGSKNEIQMDGGSSGSESNAGNSLSCCSSIDITDNDDNQNTIKETVHSLKPDLETIRATSSSSLNGIRPNGYQFGHIRAKSNVNSARIDTIPPLMGFVVQNKLHGREKLAKGESADSADAFKQQDQQKKVEEMRGSICKEKRSIMETGEENEKKIKREKMREFNEIRVRETIQKSNCDSCHRNKKSVSRRGEIRELVDKIERNRLAGNSSWSLQLSSRLPISSGKPTLSDCNDNDSNNNNDNSNNNNNNDDDDDDDDDDIGSEHSSREDSSGTKVISGNSNNLYQNDDEKNGRNSNCNDCANKLEVEPCLSQMNDKSTSKSNSKSKSKSKCKCRSRCKGEPIEYQVKYHKRTQKQAMTGIKMHDIGNALYMSGSTLSPVMPIHFTLVTTRPSKEVLLHKENKLNRLMLRSSIDGDGQKMVGRMDSDLSGFDRLKEEEIDNGRQIQESFYEAKHSNYDYDDDDDDDDSNAEKAFEDEREVKDRLRKKENNNNNNNNNKWKRSNKNGIKRKELPLKLMNNNSGVTGMQIAFRSAPDASGLLDLERKQRCIRCERYSNLNLNLDAIPNSDPKSNSNLNSNLELSPSPSPSSGLGLGSGLNPQSKMTKLINDVKRKFNKRSLDSMDTLPDIAVGPSLFRANELVLVPAGMLSPSASKNNNNNINNVVTTTTTTATTTPTTSTSTILSVDLNNNKANNISATNSQLIINNSQPTNFQVSLLNNKSFYDNNSKTNYLAETDNNQQQKRPKYYWFMLLGTIIVPNLASTVLFARAYLKMREFKMRTYMPIPLAAATLTSNLPALLMPNSPLPIIPQHQIYTFPASKNSEKMEIDKAASYNDAIDNNKPASANCQSDDENYNQSEKIMTTTISNDRKDVNGNTTTNNNDDNDNNNDDDDDDNDNDDDGNNDESEVVEVSCSGEERIQGEQQQQQQQSTKKPDRRDGEVDGSSENQHKRTMIDYDWSRGNIGDDFFQNGRSLSQPNGSSSQLHHYYHYQQQQQKQRFLPVNHKFSPVNTLIEPTQIDQGRDHRQVNQVMSAPLGYDPYLLKRLYNPIPNPNPEGQQKQQWYPQLQQLQHQHQRQQLQSLLPPEPSSGYFDRRPSQSGGLNPNCYMNTQQEVSLINPSCCEFGNLNSGDRGDISFSAPPSANFRQQDVYRSGEVFESQTEPNQRDCLSSDRETQKLSGSNDFRQQHEPAYEFRRQRHHAQSFHYGSSIRPSQYAVLPSNHGLLLESEEQEQQRRRLAKIHQSVVLQPAHNATFRIAQPPIERTHHQRSPVANSQQLQQQQQQHLLERHRSLPRSSRLHQSESGQPHLATIGHESRIGAPPSELNQRLSLTDQHQLWQRQQSEHKIRPLQHCQRDTGGTFDSSTTDTATTTQQASYTTHLKLTMDDSYPQSGTSSHWSPQIDETNNNIENHQKVKQKQNKQSHSETNKQLQLQRQQQNPFNKITQHARFITDPTATTTSVPMTTTNKCSQTRIVVAVEAQQPITTASNSTATTFNVTTTTTSTSTPVTSTSPNGVSKQGQQQQQQQSQQHTELGCGSSERSPKQLSRTSEHLTQQQHRLNSQKPLSLTSTTSQSCQLVNNKQANNGGQSNQNKAILCTYSYMTDDQLLKSNIIVFILNLTLWLPFILLSIVIQYREHLTQELKDSVWWMATLNCCSCSYVYALTNKDFREAFNKLFYYCCCKSHVTFQKKTPIFRRQLDVDSKGNLRIHIIPGLNVYSNKLLNGLEPVIGLGSSNMHANNTNAAMAATATATHSLSTTLHHYDKTSTPGQPILAESVIGISSYHNSNDHDYEYHHHQQQQQYDRHHRKSTISHPSSSINAPQSSQSASYAHNRSHTALGTGFECPLFESTSKGLASTSGHDNQISNYRSHPTSSVQNIRYNNQTASAV